MFNLKNNKITVGVLIVLVAGIWSYNVYSFMDIGSGEELQGVQRHTLSSFEDLETDSSAAADYTYAGNFRDPFDYRPLMPEKKPAKPEVRRQKPVEKEIKLPPVKLTGIIERTAILQEDGSAIHFLEKGETWKGISISKIWKDSIEVRYQGKRFTLNLSTE